MADKAKRPLGYCEKGYPDAFTSAPPYPDRIKPGQLTKQQFDQFFTDGFVVINNFFARNEVDPARSAIEKLVDDLANKLFNGGKIKKRYEEYGLFERLTMIEKEFPGANVLLHKHSKLPQAFRNLFANDRLLNVVEQLLGTADVVGNPNWNLRPKTPKSLAVTVPWHQDSAYLDNDSYQTRVITAWIPFLDANEKNGCMQVARGGQRSGKIGTHTCCVGDTWYVMLDEQEMEHSLGVDMNKDIVTCDVPYGGVLLFTNALPHRSLNNFSDEIRWSIDLRWQAEGTPNGLWGLKEGIRLRSSTDPNLQPDWESFDSVDRNKAQQEYMGHKPDEFDTTIQGPWMAQWDLTHLNRHTDAYQAQRKVEIP